MYRASFGDRLFIFLVAVYYLFPSFYNLIWPTDINSRLTGDPSWLAGLVFSVIFCVVFLLIKKLFFRGGASIYVQSLKCPWVFSAKVRWIMLLLFLPVSIKFSMDFPGSFRHQQAYASSGFIPLAYYMLRSYHIVALIVYLSNRYEQKKDPVYCLVFAGCIVATLSASFDAIVLLACFVAALKGSRAGISHVLGYVFRSRIVMASVPFLILIIALVIRDVAITDYFLAKGGLFWGIDMLATRLSYHAYHFSYFLVHPQEWFLYWGEAFEILSDQTARRFYILLGIEYHTETYQTVNRLNYLVFDPYSDRAAGSSPGVFANFVYVPFGPVGLPFLALYVAYVLSCFDKIMGSARYSWPVYFLALYILLGVISSPVDTFNVFSTSFFTLLLLSMSAYRFKIGEGGVVYGK